MSVAIVKYNAGNTASVANALMRLGVEPAITDDPSDLRAASHVIFPGVGHAKSAMDYLRARGLDKVIASLTQPTLAICVGLQLLCSASEEGNTEGIGIFGAKVRRFSPGLKVPHMGWNTVPLDASGLGQGHPRFYFLHAYRADLSPDTAAATSYGEPFSAIMRKRNFLAVQFHPEKSGRAGAALLEKFLAS